MPDPDIPVCYLVFNGSLGMSPGKMASQAFQACQRLYAVASAGVAPGHESALQADWRRRLEVWATHTTTIARVANTAPAWERVKADAAGVLMIDEGFTEVEPHSETVFACWPVLPGEAPKILSHANVPLLGYDSSRERAAFVAGFDVSAQGFNGEHSPHASRDLVEQDLRQRFAAWRRGD